MKEYVMYSRGGVYNYIPKNASHTGKAKHTYGYFIDVTATHTKHENESTFFSIVNTSWNKQWPYIWVCTRCAELPTNVWNAINSSVKYVWLRTNME